MILYRACNSAAAIALEYIPTLDKNASLYEYYYNYNDGDDDKGVGKDYDNINGVKEYVEDSYEVDSSGANSDRSSGGIGVRHSTTVAGVGNNRVRTGGGMSWGGRTGHGTALVSPSARARESGAANGGVLGLGGGVISDDQGKGGGGGETDLELAMRQVSDAVDTR